MELPSWLKDLQQLVTVGILPEDNSTQGQISPLTKDFDPSEAVSYYPTERHIRRGLAPETGLTYGDVAAIARARKQAEATGVLTPELGDHMLPIAVTEGWGTSMGVKQDQAFYASPRLRQSLDLMGLKEGEDYMTTYVKGERHIMPIHGDPANGPKMAAVILGEKAKLKQAGGTVEGAVKAYNGKGAAIEQMWDGAQVPANVNTYWGKVSEARRLLSHEKNAPLFNYFQQEYQR